MWLKLKSASGRPVLVNMARANEARTMDDGTTRIYFTDTEFVDVANLLERIAYEIADEVAE